MGTKRVMIYSIHCKITHLLILIFLYPFMYFFFSQKPHIVKTFIHMKIDSHSSISAISIAAYFQINRIHSHLYPIRLTASPSKHIKQSIQITKLDLIDDQNNIFNTVRDITLWECHETEINHCRTIYDNRTLKTTQ